MSKYNFSDVQSPDSWGKIVTGSFTSNGTSDPTVTKGTGYTVSRTGTGVHLITLTGKVGQLIATVAGEDYAGAVDTIRTSVTATSESAGTIEVTTISGASGAARSATDVGSDVTVNFYCFYRSTTVQP